MLAAIGWVKPIALGALILLVGLAPWTILAPINARARPDLPWAALATAVFLFVFVAWLNGTGWPKGTSEARWQRLRLWPPVREQGAWKQESAPVFGILILLAALYLLWILIGGSQQPPDLSAYPTTAYRFSIVIMGAVVSGVVEETAFRGYMQSGLSHLGPVKAITVTSIVFALFHGVHGLQALLLLGPGLFLASVLYGLLAHRTGTIAPGMLVHTTGDLAYTFFGVLRGDASLLFA